MCCVGYRFPDSGSRERELYCDEQRGLWRVRVPHQNPFTLKFLLPDCTDAETVFWASNGTKKVITYLNENSTLSEKNAMMKEADFMIDVLVPAIIIGILLLGNGVILYIIFHFKKRKLADEVPEEELRISQNGLNSTTGKPSDV
ncbi:hypothetical protein J437_LFUL008948 [Ladona fulva]|uniref:Uncharacterized protein n=1 Tax=Ladona fulva TaxID=123851 RepID=A0A8K0KE20_LADFU|nr:hypothetical protein J437_LFUL008948 [Ladona fulva]